MWTRMRRGSRPAIATAGCASRASRLRSGGAPQCSRLPRPSGVLLGFVLAADGGTHLVDVLAQRIRDQLVGARVVGPLKGNPDTGSADRPPPSTLNGTGKAHVRNP